MPILVPTASETVQYSSHPISGVKHALLDAPPCCIEKLHIAEKGTLVLLVPDNFLFFLGGATPPLHPLPFGIVVVMNFVRLGFALSFLYHLTKECSSPSFSAVATV